jgi:hypothetical protein
MRVVDSKWRNDPSVDFKMTLTFDELSLYVSGESALALAKLVNDEFDEIVLRRCEPEGRCIGFHLDVSERVVQVALNDDNCYTGGRLMFLIGDGKVVVPKRPAGSYTIHNRFVVHGVSEHTTGLRYGLFLIKYKVAEEGPSRSAAAPQRTIMY